MAYAFVINTNWIFKIAWGIVAPWLDPRTRTKVTFSFFFSISLRPSL